MDCNMLYTVSVIEVVISGDVTVTSTGETQDGGIEAKYMLVNNM